MKELLSKIQILYCCPLDTVRMQVGRLAYAKKLPFGIASMWEDPKMQKWRPRIVNSFSCENDLFPSLVIADMETTIELLKENKEEKIVMHH